MSKGKNTDLSSRQWKAQRLRVLQRDAYICHWCGGVATQADHVVPRVAGGSDDMDNLVASCQRCNGRKGRKPAGVFLRAQSTPLVFSDNLSRLTSSNIPNGPFEALNESRQA